MVRKRRCSAQTLSLLALLIEGPRAWRYGYELSQETGLSSGTLYPVLTRLSDRRLLESRWEESPERGRPPRHMYRLTSEGVAYAREQLSESAGAKRPSVLRGQHA